MIQSIYFGDEKMLTLLPNDDVANFSTESTYAVGDVVKYNNKFYKCTEAVDPAGAWDSSKWSNITPICKNTWDDWKILPTERPVFAPPSQKTTYVDIPGGNGALDLSESLTGYPVYENRTGSFTFRVMNDYKEWNERYTEIMDFLHGKERYAILYDDPEYYYKGRFSVNGWKAGDTWSEIEIEYTVEPYKFSRFNSDDDWLWNPFNFNDGIISTDLFKDINVYASEQEPLKYIFCKNPDPENENEKPIELFGSAPFNPYFICDYLEGNLITAILKNDYLNLEKTYTLQNGNNDIWDFVFYGSEDMSDEEKYEIQLYGIGAVSIHFRVGRL